VDAGLRRGAGAGVVSGLLRAGVQLVLARQVVGGGLLRSGAGLAALWTLVLPGRRR
jgi:hypothetical protein